MTIAGYILLALAIIWIVAYLRVPLWITSLVVAVALGALTYSSYPVASSGSIALWAAFVLIAAPVNFGPLRRVLISNAVFKAFRKLMPQIGRASCRERV